MKFLIEKGEHAGVYDDRLEAESLVDDLSTILEFKDENELMVYTKARIVATPDYLKNDAPKKEVPEEDDFVITKDSIVFYTTGQCNFAPREEDLLISWGYLASGKGTECLTSDMAIVPKDTPDYSMKGFLGEIVAIEQAIDYALKEGMKEIIISYENPIIGEWCAKTKNRNKIKAQHLVSLIDELREANELKVNLKLFPEKYKKNAGAVSAMKLRAKKLLDEVKCK